MLGVEKILSPTPTTEPAVADGKIFAEKVEDVREEPREEASGDLEIDLKHEAQKGYVEEEMR